MNKKWIKLKFKDLKRLNLICFIGFHKFKKTKYTEEVQCKRCRNYRINDIRVEKYVYNKSLFKKSIKK